MVKIRGRMRNTRVSPKYRIYSTERGKPSDKEVGDDEGPCCPLVKQKRKFHL